MPSSTTVFAFLVALKSQLSTRPGLAGVKVHLVAPGNFPLEDSIVLVWTTIQGEQKPAALGQLRRNDSHTVPGVLRAYAAAGAAGSVDASDVFQAAGERADALLNEIALELRDNRPGVGDQTIAAEVSSYSHRPWTSDKGGWIVDTEFTITYTARVQ